jgi:hypothetical protein
LGKKAIYRASSTIPINFEQNVWRSVTFVEICKQNEIQRYFFETIKTIILATTT